MTTKRTVDPDLAKSLYVNGLTFAEISRKLGINQSTLCNWATRYKWRAMRHTREVAQKPALEQLADELSGRALKICQRILARLELAKLGEIKECKDAAVALGSAYATARRALGLDDKETMGKSVNVYVYAQSPVTPYELRDAPPIQDAIIDVESTTEQPPLDCESSTGTTPDSVGA